MPGIPVSIMELVHSSEPFIRLLLFPVFLAGFSLKTIKEKPRWLQTVIGFWVLLWGGALLFHWAVALLRFILPN